MIKWLRKWIKSFRRSPCHCCRTTKGLKRDYPFGWICGRCEKVYEEWARPLAEDMCRVIDEEILESLTKGS